MKKRILTVLTLLLLCGCSSADKNPSDGVHAHCVKDADPVRIEVSLSAPNGSSLLDGMSISYKGPISMLGLSPEQIAKDDPKMMTKLIKSLVKGSTGAKDDEISVDYSKDQTTVTITPEECTQKRLQEIESGIYNYIHSSYLFQDYKKDLEEDGYACE